ncbi:MAG: hypothetical protein K2R98_00135 [Gemmataceae bacterium]|nr:hypothetical protein [Gemmataceae bacterium]
MSIDFTCNGCGTYLQAGDHLVGRVLKCYKCGGLFTVPTASTISRPNRPSAASSPPPAPAAPPPMPTLAPSPPPMPAPMAMPPMPAAAEAADFELPPDFGVDEPIQPMQEEPVEELVDAEDILMLEEDPGATAPAPAEGAIEEFDAADILLLEEEPPKKKKK